MPFQKKKKKMIWKRIQKIIKKKKNIKKKNRLYEKEIKKHTKKIKTTKSQESHGCSSEKSGT
ncbi:hypothetical protein JP0003_02440 [Helicobacter pylori]